MTTFVALLRGINVGGRNIVPMKQLVAALEGVGYKDVRTYIQSGNLVLQGDEKLNEGFSSVVERHFGFQPEVLFLTKEQLIGAFENCPYRSADGKTVHFYFCSESPVINEDRLLGLKARSEAYTVKGQIFYLHAPEGIGRSKLVKNVEACLGVAATGRNMNTVNKLIQMVSDVP